MSEMLHSPEFRGHTHVHMNCGAFCILEHDGRYALLLNNGREHEGKEPALTPIGGGITVVSSARRMLEERLSLPIGSFDAPFNFGKNNQNQVLRAVGNMLPGDRNLRFIMSLTRNNLDFITQWLQERHEGRELSPFREMTEELTVESRLLNPDEVKQIQYDLAGYSAFWKGLKNQVPELKIMELYNLHPPEEVLERLLEAAQRPESPLYFATAEEIEAGKTIHHQRIGTSARMLFNPKPTIEIPEM